MSVDMLYLWLKVLLEVLDKASTIEHYKDLIFALQFFPLSSTVAFISSSYFMLWYMKYTFIKTF